MYKITSFIIAIAVASLFIATLTNMHYEISDNNNMTISEEDKETMESFDQISSLRNNTEEIEERYDEGSVDSSKMDILGNMLADGINSVSMMFSSIPTFFTMAKDAVQVLKLPLNFKYTLYIVIITMIVIGVFIRLKLRQVI